MSALRTKAQFKAYRTKYLALERSLWYGHITRKDFFNRVCKQLGGSVLVARLTDRLGSKNVKGEIVQADETSHIQPNDKKFVVAPLEELFGAFRDNTNFAPGTAHYDFFGIHPDDAAAMRTIGCVFTSIIGERFKPDYIPFLTSGNFSGNFICTGDAFSNAFARLILQYKYKSDDPKEGMVREDEPVLRLPYETILDVNFLRSRGNKSFLETEHHEPNWSLRDNTRSDDEDNLLIPKVREDLRLETDFLTVGVFSNILDRDSYDRGDKVIVFGGGHGTGTKAIDLLFKDSELVSVLLDTVRTTPSGNCEVVFNVSGIEVGEGGRSIAHSISLNKDMPPRPVELDDSKLRELWANLPHKKRYVQGENLPGLTPVVSTMEKESPDALGLQGGGSNHQTDSSSRGGDAPNPNGKTESRWTRSYGSYRNNELRALKFSSKEQFHAAIDLIYDDTDLKGLPADIVGRNTLIVPTEAVEYFANKGLKPSILDLVDPEALTLEELRERRRTHGM